MVDLHNVLAIVPARGGSKSIPRKNIKPLGGIPLIAYSIAAGLQAEMVDRVIVSTDDPEIAEIAQHWGAELPFLRPPELAQDDTPDLPVFQHTLQWLAERENYIPDVVVQLRPTSPLRPPDCVDQAVTALRQYEKADSVRGVVPSGQNPFKMWRFQDDGYMQPLLQTQFDEPYNMPRQNLPDTYWQTGHIDAIRYATIMDQQSMTGRYIWPLVLDPRYTIDIDTDQDWQRAEWMLGQMALPFVQPGANSETLPKDIRLLVLDFDGVLTDNRVWVDQNGREQVACYRSDGTGLSRLKEQGIELFVLSKERNPVVGARCRKLDLPYHQGIDHKAPLLKKMVEERNLTWNQVVYVGNDVNDLECMGLAGCGVAVADAHPTVKAQANLILKRLGGRGAVRELCDRIIDQLVKET